jgi:hypothetical protein
VDVQERWKPKNGKQEEAKEQEPEKVMKQYLHLFGFH